MDRVFNGRWARNADYSPRLAPSERGFSLVWALVQKRLEEEIQFVSLKNASGTMKWDSQEEKPVQDFLMHTYRTNR